LRKFSPEKFDRNYNCTNATVTSSSDLLETCSGRLDRLTFSDSGIHADDGERIKFKAAEEDDK